MAPLKPRSTQKGPAMPIPAGQPDPTSVVTSFSAGSPTELLAAVTTFPLLSSLPGTPDFYTEVYIRQNSRPRQHLLFPAPSTLPDGTSLALFTSDCAQGRQRTSVTIMTATHTPKAIAR